MRMPRRGCCAGSRATTPGAAASHRLLPDFRNRSCLPLTVAGAYGWAQASGTTMAQAKNFFHGIQYLRGLAALVVVLVHARHYFKPTAASWPEIGTYSVEIFLVVSGFVLAHTTAALP
ncbi:MAG: acyltransferase, partial [Gammaproteobacteria bacterium]|nr:acyltransferase [Gammaproteobacteria bacterium]